MIDMTTTPPAKGPLAALADRAAESTILRQAQQHIPASARPALERTREPATRVLHAVDNTLTTEEAQRVATTASDFMHAVAGFTLLLLSLAVTQLESALKIPTPPPADPVAQPSVVEPDSDSDNLQPREHDEDEATKVQKARLLFSRYALVAQTVYKKFSKGTPESAAKDVPTGPVDSKSDPKSLEKAIAAHARSGLNVMSEISAYSLSRASRFQGPGASTIAPAANYIISSLPEKAKEAVHNSRCPFQGLCNRANTDTTTNSASNDVVLD